jgi:hypothetical protein
LARKGLPAKYAKMGFKRGWRAYKASKRGGSAPRKVKTKTVRRRKSYSRRGRRASRKFTLPLAPIAGVIAGFTMAPPGWEAPVTALMRGDMRRFGDAVLANWTFIGKDGKVDFAGKGIGVKATIIGLVVHKIAGLLGVNRVLGQARVPIVRV